MEHVAEYAQSPADAWRLVMYLQDKGYPIRISNKSSKSFWWVYITPLNGGRDVIIQAETMPLAVALAAIELITGKSPLEV